MFRLVNVIVAIAVGALATMSPGSVHKAQPRASLPAGAVRASEFDVGERFDIAAEVNVERQAADAAEAARRQQEAAAQAAAQAAAARAAAAQAAARRTSPTSAPTALPAAPATSYPAGSIQAIIHDAFAPYGQAAIDWGERVARCESGYNPRAYNPAGPYYGLFQFLMSTFKATPYGNQDIYDPVANADAAAWKYSQGGQSAWGCS